MKTLLLSATLTLLVSPLLSAADPWVVYEGTDGPGPFRPVQFFGNVASLMEVTIDTGKTHQIRVHAAYAGHPVAGDDKYGDRAKNEELKAYGLARMFLHAASIGVERPGTHEPLNVSAPLDEDLHRVLEALLKAPGSRRGARRR